MPVSGNLTTVLVLFPVLILDVIYILDCYLSASFSFFCSICQNYKFVFLYVHEHYSVGCCLQGNLDLGPFRHLLTNLLTLVTGNIRFLTWRGMGMTGETLIGMLRNE